MSYCRWDDGDLYIYDDVRGGLTCCGCRLLGKPGIDGWSFNCATRSAMIAHIEEHRAAGHDVQGYVGDALRAEIGEFGDVIST